MSELIKLSPELGRNISDLESAIIVVSDQKQREYAIGVIRDAKSLKSKIVEFFKESKDNAYKAWKAICANEKTFTDRLDYVEREAKRQITGYDQKQEAIREKERARLQAIEDEKARKERERLLKKAESLKSPERQEAILEEAANITAPVLLISGDRSAPLYGYMHAALQSCLKQVSKVTIADAGHMMYQANPTAFLFEVQEFVAPQ